MSRFFSRPACLSSSDSSDEEADEPFRAHIVNYSNDDEVKRIVKPAKEKFYDKVKSIVQLLNNYKKINDYSSLLSGFDDLVKAFNKVLNVISEDECIPHFLVRALGELQLFVNAVWENSEARKCLSKLGYKSLASLRQRLRKFNKTYEHEIAAYLDNVPTQISVSSDEEEIDQGKKPQSSNSSLESDSSYDSEISAPKIRETFLKKNEEKNVAVKKKERKEKNYAKDLKKQNFDESGWETVKRGQSTFLDAHKMFVGMTEITLSRVNAKLSEICLSKNLKRAERRLRIDLLSVLLNMALQNNLGLGIETKLRLAEIRAILEYDISALEPIKAEYWDKLLKCVLNLASEVVTADSLIISEDVDDDEKLENAPFKVCGDIAALGERLVDEFVKGLKHCDPYQNEYAEKLRDDAVIGDIIDKFLSFLEKNGQVNEICRIKLCKIEHIYYKYDSKVFNGEQGESSLKIMDELCKYVYNNDTTQRLRTRAILAHIYHLALHDKWTSARDLMLMSHLQSNIQHADACTQILYNRSIAQLGLCAFRNGLITEAHSCLSDLITTGRVREMLGQGFTTLRNVERSYEQEQRERQYQMPFHMFINLDLLECSYFVAAMLIDVPIMAAQELDGRRRLISKAFYQLLRASERVSLSGPPETMREYVVAASRALRSGQWHQCKEFIFNAKMNAKVWDIVQQPSPFKEKIIEAIQRQALKSYIFAYAAPVYTSLLLSKLSAMFELSNSELYNTLSAMILEGELEAALDMPTNTLIFQKCAGRTALQALASQLTDKLGYLLDTSERCGDRPTRLQTRQSRPI